MAGELEQRQTANLQRIAASWLESFIGKRTVLGQKLRDVYAARDAAVKQREEQERLRVATEHFRTTMEKLRFEWQRFQQAPGSYILNALGWGGIGRGLPAAAVKEAERPMRFAEVSLARQAIQGVSVTKAGVQIVHDKSLDTVIALLRENNQLTRAMPATGVYGP